MTNLMVRLCCDYNHSNDMEIIEIANLLDELSKDIVKNYNNNRVYDPSVVFNYGVSSGNLHIPTVIIEGFSYEIHCITALQNAFVKVTNQFYNKYKNHIHVIVYKIKESYIADKLIIKGE